ncbi:Uncharacterized protein TCM_023950 [Theobroma cacao]|uniref:Uncharacterized protein n=1 Tax=Theobroma cacao TaxID=3641 RepID=A0A061EVG5_THECC|nr:Uncharacterized protein TCM_023950 [Theobroma cacao]
MTSYVRFLKNILSKKRKLVSDSRATSEVFMESQPVDPFKVSLISESEPNNEKVIECVNDLNFPSRVLGT